MSQIPNSVGATQPKLISGSTTREIAAITAGSGEPAPLLRQKKLQRSHHSTFELPLLPKAKKLFFRFLSQRAK